MNESEILTVVTDLLKKVAPDTDPSQLKADDNIRTTLEIDSFDYLQFIVALDDKFGIETPEEDYGKIQSLKDVTTYIMDKLP